MNSVPLPQKILAGDGVYAVQIYELGVFLHVRIDVAHGLDFGVCK